MSISIKPTGKWILVRLIKPDAGNILLADANGDATRIHQAGMQIVRVVDVGEGRMASDGKIVPIDLEPGQEIFVAPDTPLCTPNPTLYGSDDLMLMDVKDVMGKVNGRDGDKLPMRLPEIMQPVKKLVH